MVILFFDDGHAESYKDEILATPYAQTKKTQTVNILTPEEIELYKGEGIMLPIGHEDPRRKLDWRTKLEGHIKGAKF